jgi:hypothetical protein
VKVYVDYLGEFWAIRTEFIDEGKAIVFRCDEDGVPLGGGNKTVEMHSLHEFTS